MHKSKLFGMLAGAALAALATSPASAQTDVKFALDWKFEGPAAPYFVAIDKGYYKAEGINVSIDPGSGSVEGGTSLARLSEPSAATSTRSCGASSRTSANVQARL